MSITKRLKEVLMERDESSDPLYLLEEVRAVCSEVVQLDDSHWLAFVFEDGNRLWVEFALFDFARAIIIENQTLREVRVALVFEGEGPAGDLREMRHVWWGPKRDGYTHHLPATAVIKALQYLGKYFDLDD